MASLRFLALFLLAACLLTLATCGDSSTPTPPPSPSPNAKAPPPPSPQITDLLFTYGSEKEAWINETTATFNASQTKSKSGKIIRVQAVPMGSGECIDEILAGTTKAHLTSPASAAFIKIGNAKSRVKTNTDLIPATDNLVLSPVVIAMWKPMAEALGHGKKPIGWAEILALAKNPQGWAAHNHPEWGAFKFGHTHPEFSNSGLISVLAEVYAGANKTNNLTLEDVHAPATANFVQAIESTIVHYGSSTGFFGKKMFAGGPTYLSAAVLYENMVIESYNTPNREFDVVAIYPKEGTFWSDHPVGIVQREWVTPEHAAAAKIYIDYLLADPQQKKALAYGFRPASTSIPLSEPINTAHGVNPNEPQNVLPVPEADTMEAILALWRANKKHADIVLVLDTSGSMKENNKMANARAGAAELVKMLGNEDSLSLLPFSDNFRWSGQRLLMKNSREQAAQTVANLMADGGTRLFDSIDAAYTYQMSNPAPGKISAVVVLTDGADTASTSKLPQLLSRIRSDSEKKSIRIFTIGYGKDAKKDELKKIADETQAKFYEGKPENIRQVFKDIATFF